MPATINVDGPAVVQVDTGTSHALETLGYTRDGVEVRFEGHFVDVPGDENGGEAGPPIDVQYMGERAIIRLELTKYDAIVAGKIAARVWGETSGVPADAGTLFFGSGKAFRVLINTTERPYNFPRCIPREPIEVNKGTRFSRLIIVFEAHKDATGVLYNDTIT